MKKALVIYHSKTGITRTFGKEISDYLGRNYVESTFISINDYRESDIQDVDYLFLGCWTSGLMVLLQHPEKAWVEFSNRLPDLNGKKIGLFTTYKLATGSMFKGMRKRLRCNRGDVVLELKSRDGHLTEPQCTQLRSFIQS
jgi:flavodoxin